jgi:hypothetical protein
MKQHLFRGRGAPDFVPTGYSHLYLDTISMEHWLSIGNSTVSDWVGPFATVATVQKAIDDYAAGIDDLTDKVVLYVEVVNYANRGRYITIDPTIHAGKFLIIKDPDNRPDLGFKVEIVPSGRTHLGSQIWVYNDTPKITSLDNYNCMVNYPLGQTNKNLEPKGVMIVRPLDVNLEMFTYLITGTMNATIPAPTEQVNAIDAEHRANVNNPHQTDKDQVGLSNVLNYGIATIPEAMDGLRGDAYMTPVSVKAAISAQALTPLHVHIEDMDNPHLLTKDQIELGNVENYTMAVDVDGVFAGDQDLEQASDRLYASPRTIAIAITRYAELNAPLLLADSEQGTMAGEQNFDDLEKSTVVSPWTLGVAIEAYDEARVWATQNEAEDAAYGPGDAASHVLLDPRGLGYAFEKFKELNPSSEGGGQLYLEMSSTPVSEDFNFNFEVMPEEVVNTFINLRGGDHDYPSRFKLQLGSLGDFPEGGTFTLFNNTGSIMRIAVNSGSAIIYSGIDTQFVRSSDISIAIGGVVTLKLLGDNDWACWGDLTYPGQDGKLLYTEMLPGDSGYEFYRTAQKTIGKFIRLMPNMSDVQEEYYFYIEGEAVYPVNSEFTLFNDTPSRLYLNFGDMAGTVYAGMSNSPGFNIVVKAGGVVDVKLLTQSGPETEWLVRGNTEFYEVPI